MLNRGGLRLPPTRSDGIPGRAERVYALSHVSVLPETRYARSGDLMIAYRVVGEGQPRDLVIAPGTVSHLDLELEYWPDVVREYESIARYCRVIGSTSEAPAWDRGVYAATLEERTDDIRAVMDAAGSERAFVPAIAS